MPIDLLPFRAAPAVAPAPTAPPPARPDVAVAALSLFGRLRDALRRAARVRDRRAALAARGWHVPPLFFFHRGLQADWLAVRPDPAPDAHWVAARRADPAGAAAWDHLPDLAADALSVLAGSVEARHAARAVPGLVAAARGLGPDSPPARAVADLLAVADDDVVRVVHPAAGLGWRVVATGVADIYQFHALFADAVSGADLPGPRIDRRAVAAYRGWPPAAGEAPPVAAAKFQFYSPLAVRPDGTLPAGFGGSDHWFWGPEPLAAVPRIDGERVVVIGPPAFAGAWDAEPKYPRLPAGVEVIERLDAAAVDGWLRGWCGAAPRRRPAAGRRAA